MGVVLQQPRLTNVHSAFTLHSCHVLVITVDGGSLFCDETEPAHAASSSGSHNLGNCCMAKCSILPVR
jgi:hypothetical protein